MKPTNYDKLINKNFILGVGDSYIFYSLYGLAFLNPQSKYIERTASHEKQRDNN